MSGEAIQEVKVLLSTKVLGNISNKSAQNILRKIIFNPAIQETIDWNFVKQQILLEMPELTVEGTH